MVRRLFAVLLFVVAIAVSAVQPAHASSRSPAGAIPRYGETTYYSDATLTTEVGWRIQSQCGPTPYDELYGVVTPYYRNHFESCVA
jgi:hypothetical protein